jgi:hypothetical protein
MFALSLLGEAAGGDAGSEGDTIRIPRNFLVYGKSICGSIRDERDEFCGFSRAELNVLHWK